MFQLTQRCTAFSGMHRIAIGELRHVAIKARQAHEAHPSRRVLVFDDATGAQIDLPLELPAAEFLRFLGQPETLRAQPDVARRPGRPRLGVTAREVTLLPRHWDWLAIQPGGASAALRRLIDAARDVSADADRRRASQEAAWRFIQAIAGDLPACEDAARALFAGDAGSFEQHSAAWPDDVREHALLLAADAFLG